MSINVTLSNLYGTRYQFLNFSLLFSFSQCVTPSQWGLGGGSTHSRLSKTTKLIIAWFTSLRGVCQPKLSNVCKCIASITSFLRADESPLNWNGFSEGLCSISKILVLRIESMWVLLLMPYINNSLYLKRCLNWPSLNCLIHFYKRCVSTHALGLKSFAFLSGPMMVLLNP